MNARLAPLRKRPPIQTILRFLAQVHKQNRHMITRVSISVALHDDAVAVDFFALGRCQVDRHLSPLGDRFISSKFDAVGADLDEFGRKGQAGLRTVDGQGLKDAGPVEFASAHIG
jgi:hypothetical protein